MNRTASVLKVAVTVTAALYLLMYLVLALLRISYPFELEWMEGSMVDHVQRILDGKSLYVAPSISFVPFAYPPLYFYISAGLAKLTGIGFLPLRLISLFSSLGALALIALLVKKETHAWRYGLLAAGVFAATYRACGAWLDIGRVDSLLVLLLLGAVYLLRFHSTRSGAAISGLLLALAALTKQTALLTAGPLFLYLLLVRRDLLLWALLPFLAVAGGSAVALNAASDGWFRYYVFEQPAHHSLMGFSLFYFVAHDLGARMGVAVVAAVVGYREWRDRKARMFYGMVILGLFLASLLPRIKAGGYNNDLIPVFAGLSIMLGLMSARLAGRRAALVYGAAGVQLAMLIYNPLHCLPTAEDRQAGQTFYAKVAAEPGDVLLFSHGFASALAGKNTAANYIAVTDVLSAGNSRACSALVKDFRGAVESRRYSAIILDDDDPLAWNEIGISRHYGRSETAINKAGVFWPVSGFPTRPAWIFRPRISPLN